jgi:hypothetical protein
METKLTFDLNKYKVDNSFTDEKARKEKFNHDKKKLYEIVKSNWDSTRAGPMTPSRFYSSVSHLKSQEDLNYIRGMYKECKELGKDFVPIFWSSIHRAPKEYKYD